MNKKSLTLRVAVAGIGGLMLTAVAGAAAFADPVQQGDDTDVSVSVNIPGNDGVLALTVAGTSTTLGEDTTAATAADRVFTGSLPAVTVTDTRDAADIAPDAFWYVNGSASEFTGNAGQPAISASQLGWTPSIIDTEGTGEVAPGEQVLTSRDDSTSPDPTTPNNVGLVGKELLAIVGADETSGSIRETGQWTAGADLTLKTPLNVAPGTYTSTLTLSLFEDAS